MENLFWKKRKVFITGHTGFKGSWLSLWLTLLGADVIGYSLNSPSEPNLFETARLEEDVHSIKGDILNYTQLFNILDNYEPEIIFHLAAQPLVRTSYYNPVETFKTNVIGTVHILEAVRHVKSIKAVVNVTSDKCYDNHDAVHRMFQEQDPMGGHDPYSASKGCAELVTNSYRKTYFTNIKESYPNIATVRSGNVIGGGDWAQDRLFPDVIRALLDQEILTLRNPKAVRPWQHVLDPLNGYLMLAEKLWNNSSFSEGWNFGPDYNKGFTVAEILNMTMDLWGKTIDVHFDGDKNIQESSFLMLDSSKARERLGWVPKLSTKDSIEWSVQWYKNFNYDNDIKTFTLNQIKNFEELKGLKDGK